MPLALPIRPQETRRIRARLPTFSHVAVYALAALLATASGARAGGVVTNCADDADLSSKLAGGRTVSFACGTATIILSSTQTIGAGTTIDGGGTITLSGGNAVRLFSVSSGATLTLKNVVLTDGFFSGGDGGAIVNTGTLNLNGATVKSSQVDAAHSGGGHRQLRRGGESHR